MTTSFLAAALVLAVIAIALAFAAWDKRRTIAEEREWLPEELANAQVVFAERDFFVDSPDRIVARVDRVYRRPDQVHVVTELKRRPHARVFESDRIELSVQRMAVAFSGYRVSERGYVVVEDESGRRRAIPVQLLGDQVVLKLATRFRELMTNRAAPVKANHLPMCRKCAYQKECQPAALKLRKAVPDLNDRFTKSSSVARRGNAVWR